MFGARDVATGVEPARVLEEDWTSCAVGKWSAATAAVVATCGTGGSQNPQGSLGHP